MDASDNTEERDVHLELDNVSLYRGTRKTLDVPHLQIYENSLTLVMGVSGSGKTTLMECLAGLLRPQRGNIYVHGDALSERLQQHQRELAYVPQENIVHPELTVQQAVHFASVLRLGSEAFVESASGDVESLLRRLRIFNVRQNRVDHLSGGQKKRVSLATEMVSSPRLLLLDEPTAGLDPGHHREFMELVREVANRGCTVVMSSHHTEGIDITDRLVLIDRGQVQEQETPEKVLNKNNASNFGELFSNILTDKPVEEDEETTGFFERLVGPVYPIYLVLRGLLFWTFVLVRDFARVLFRAFRASITRPIQSVRFGLEHLLPRLFCLLRREQIILFRHRAFLSYQLILPVAIGILIGVVSQIHTRPSRTVFFSLVAAFWLGLNTSALSIIREIGIVQKERMASPYQETYVVAYLGSKLIWYGLFGLLAGLLLSGGIYLTGTIHFSTYGKPFRVLMCIGLFELASLLGVLLGLLVSAVSENQVFAMALIPILVLPGLLLSRPVLDKPQYRPVGTPDARQTSPNSDVGAEGDRDNLLPQLWYWMYRIHPISFLYDGAPLQLRMEPGKTADQKNRFLKHLLPQTILPSLVMGFLFFFLTHLVLLFRGRIGPGVQ